ncbi:MAG: hypothetical protein NCW75_10720 [Phycisphaera sp.]|nr:MAG: hypothetical protein NCW75_10720 [Phycisphaera sp.]
MAMTQQMMFDAWIPADSPWSAWAKPVVFAAMDFPERQEMERVSLDSPPRWSWLPSGPPPMPSTAWVVDLEGDLSALTGALLAARGYRPVPLFNGSPAPRGTRGAIDTRKMEHLLANLADDLARANAGTIAADAPPVFLLDNRRMRPAPPGPGKYDNRWMAFPQDFPSARYLAEHGISRAVVVQERDRQPAEDLRHVLLRWQRAGIAMERLSIVGSPDPEAFTVRKPNRFRWALHRALAIANLRRSSAGGFGGVVPTPSEGGSGFG